MLLAQFGTGQVLWSLLWFFLFVIWIWMVMAVFADIMRSADLSGWAKALWSIFIIVLPFLGLSIYLIARGSKMQERSIDDATRREAALRGYGRDVASSDRSAADELAKLADLRDTGVITDDEFQQAKAKALL